MIHGPIPPNFDEVFLKELDNKIDSATIHVLAGRCPDYAVYKAECSKILALKETKDFFISLVSRLQNE